MRVNIYIRQEDEDLWAAIQNKPEFIHQALRGTIMPDKDSIYVDEGQKKVVSRFAGASVSGSGGSSAASKEVQPSEQQPVTKTCKNGHRSVDGIHCFNMNCVYS